MSGARLGDPVKVAYQGEPGAYGEVAVRQLFGEAATPTPLATLEDVFGALVGGEVDRAVAAIENSQAGSIHRTYDLLRKHDVHVVGETQVAVDHCLMALPGESLKTLTRVHSHPVALEQCDEYLRELGVEAVAHRDTAGSARMVAEQRLAGEGALASRRAADIYGLHVLAEGVQTVKDNRTRFVALSREPAARGEGAHKTMLVLTVGHEPGALHRALGAFASRGVNLARLESRPSRGRPWEYVFHLDVEGHQDDTPLREALDELVALGSVPRVLGSFPTGA